ncbi:MAG: hypothetical protein E7356_03970 [Clostridiales bacterium]|nr:hypothetical protein [Clostridiales bacterium]
MDSLNTLFESDTNFPLNTNKIDVDKILNDTNIDDFINMIDKKGIVPFAVRNSNFFRDFCIKKNRFDLVVQCTIPDNLFEDENIMKGICSQLDTNPSNMFQKISWLKNYYKQNNNVFNTVLVSSLRDDIFNLNKNHYERFINHIEIQSDLSQLNNNQVKILSKILNMYSFKDYDLSFAITNIVNNMQDYNELINSIDSDHLTETHIKLLVSVLQNPNNPYQINTLSDLENYTTIKKRSLVSNFNSNSLEQNKSNMLQTIFNIDLKEAEYIYEQFCHNREMVEALESSELPKENFRQLKFICDLINCNTQADLANIYNQLHGENIYNCELPLETYLRRIYNNLFSATLYNAQEKDQVFGPKEHIASKDNYNGHEVKMYFPRTKFSFMSHVVGFCSYKEDTISSNYAKDWLERPQIQDHIVACSYSTEEILGSIGDNRPIFCFDNFEGGAMTAMSYTDIDSIGASQLYNSGRTIQESNHKRAKYYVPSEFSKVMVKKGGYSELLLERRDSKNEQSLTKRAPSYIMTVVPSLRNGALTRLDTIFEQLSFIAQEDRIKISEQSSEIEIEKILNNYNDIFTWYAQEKDRDTSTLIRNYSNKILQAISYENCLRAATEFNIPLVVIDKENVFRRILDSKTQYDETTKARIYNYYISTRTNKEKIWKAVCLNEDVLQLLTPEIEIVEDYWNNDEINNVTISESSSDYDYITRLHNYYNKNHSRNSISQYLNNNYDKYQQFLEAKRLKEEEERKHMEELELAYQRELAAKAEEMKFDGWERGSSSNTADDDFDLSNWL